jgi:NADPH:quinone reductase-like Zn-dependent oxidoreductase
MKAWVATEYGSLEKMTLKEIEKPSISKGKILIEIEYASLNPYDYKLRNGIAKWMTGKNFPKVFGGDFVGKVIASQDKNNAFKNGQLVYGFANIFFREQGTLAEYTAITPKYVRQLPEGIDPINACAVVSAGLTGINGLQKCGNLNNKEILINGATGGIGHLATQIAVAKGGIVTAVCSSKIYPLQRN